MFFVDTGKVREKPAFTGAGDKVGGHRVLGSTDRKTLLFLFVLLTIEAECQLHQEEEWQRAMETEWPWDR